MAENKKRLPPPTNKSEWPYNDVEVSRCGHETIKDNTKGHEYKREAHFKGTHEDIGEGGEQRQLGISTKHQSVAQGHATTTEGPSDRQRVTGTRDTDNKGQHNEVADNMSHAIGQNIARLLKGVETFYFGDRNYNLTTGSPGARLHRIEGDDFIHNDKNHVHFVDGSRYEKTSKQWGQLAEDNYSIKSDKILELIAGQKLILKIAGSGTSITLTKNDITIKSDGTVNIFADGGPVTTNGTGSTDVQCGGVVAPPTTFTPKGGCS